ncbi:alpha/beta hydrolase [Lapillicoccus sp.]|uniref:alpha/beta fold hydrolase n=1 Tax=Lapillicoccus sp. TaxID=1909287 RepID=UPI0025FA8110|nr:alpha/beta hydrolase [Lapillicoccus sp.]
MSTTQRTTSGIAYEREGPAGGPPVVLLHAGIADRRMWEPLWQSLIGEQDVVRLDLRGFGGSTTRPVGALSPVGDTLDTLAALGVARCHLVGASFGAGVAVELTLTRPDLVASLLLCSPGGSLIAELTPDLEDFVAAERAALAADDLEAAVEANLRWWVDSPHRDPGGRALDADVCAQVARMQRLAFEVTAGWHDVEEVELDPPALVRLDEIRCPTTVLVGGYDLDAIQIAARALIGGIPGARRVDWPDTAHLPSLERPDDFLALVRECIR